MIKALTILLKPCPDYLIVLKVNYRTDNCVHICRKLSKSQTSETGEESKIQSEFEDEGCTVSF
jgi:hypothetical protein